MDMLPGCILEAGHTPQPRTKPPHADLAALTQIPFPTVRYFKVRAWFGKLWSMKTMSHDFQRCLLLVPCCCYDKWPQKEYLKTRCIYYLELRRSDFQNGSVRGSRKGPVPLSFPAFRGCPHSWSLTPCLMPTSASMVTSPSQIPPHLLSFRRTVIIIAGSLGQSQVFQDNLSTPRCLR